MRILIIHNKYRQEGGEDRHMATESALLREHGHTVELLLFDNANLLRLSLFKRFLYTLYNPLAIKKTRKTLLAFRPDIVHIHNLFYEASPAILREVKRQGIPLVLTLHNFRLLCVNACFLRQHQICTKCVHSIFPLHGIRHKCFQHSRLRSLQLQLISAIHKCLNTFRHVDAYITLTPFAKQRFIHSSLKLPPEKFVVKPNTTQDIQPASPQERENIFLFVGRLAEEKGIRFLIALFLDIPMPLHVLGTGPLEAELRQTATTAPHIQFLGQQAPQAVTRKLKQCRALLVPSLWYEGFPLSIVEAFAAGTPVIASRNDNLATIVQDQHNGILCDALHTQQWKAAIEQFQKPDPKTQKLYAGARESFDKHYAPAVNYKSLLNIYHNVMPKLDPQS